ncbi:MAG: hypothetical protein IJO63_04940 [Bacilli bacterium]|nr:hypothetical protein [Bacilli bacterium]
MESNIALKLKALNYSKDALPTINKFVPSISDEVISLEELVQIVNYLNEKGISIQRPAQQKALAGGLLFVKKQVEEMERIGELGAYVEDPVRINSKGAAQRISYLKSLDEPYKTPEGKYSKLPFRKRAFEAKYGIDYLNSVAEVVEPVIEAVPVVEAPIVEAPVERHKVTQVISFNPNKTEATEYVPEEPEITDPLIDILSKPQTIGLVDETFERYERLADSIRHVMVSVYGIEEINDSITDNLIKLVTNEVVGDDKVMYYAITYGKNITDEEERRLKETIREELEYTSILEINIGGMAA